MTCEKTDIQGRECGKPANYKLSLPRPGQDKYPSPDPFYPDRFYCEHHAEMVSRWGTETKRIKP